MTKKTKLLLLMIPAILIIWAIHSFSEFIEDREGLTFTASLLSFHKEKLIDFFISLIPVYILVPYTLVKMKKETN